jgi:hypothetical protein
MVPAVYIATPNRSAKARYMTPSFAKPNTLFPRSFNSLRFLAFYTILLKSREGSVGIATGRKADVRFPVGVRNFSTLHSIQIADHGSRAV